MDLTTSTRQLLNDISIYPNPVIDRLNIELTEDGDYSFRIMNLKGEVVSSYSNQNRIDMNNLSQGTYILEITELSTGSRTAERIVVIK